MVMDEMSMIGRQMLGKIEFKIRDTLKGVIGEDVVSQYLGGKAVVMAGDPKQAPPIIDEPLFREGEYEGKGANKPKGSDATPSGAWSSKNLVRNGMEARNTFQDAVYLRQVHRYVEEKAELPQEMREEYKKDAKRFWR